MLISVKGRQIDIGAALRAHIARRLEAAVAKYFESPIEAQVVLSRDGPLFEADVSVHVGKRLLVQSRARHDDAYTSFNAAAEKIEKRLRRRKRRLRAHHAEKPAAAPESPAEGGTDEPRGGDD